jgi:exonuclease VII small subunit
LETQKAAQEYQNSVELYYTAQENLLHAESKSSKIDNLTRQEYITHLTMKV